jgi:UDP-N-acetyl-D-glucosamine dehydrogenase
VDHVVPVAGTRVAEMVKLLENTFRLINIGLVNEMAMMCDRMNVNIWEVIHAASTKPFGFMPFYPGLGVGGHCIAVDPFYLSWKSKQVGMEARFIELAGQINGQMPYHAVGKIQSALNGNFKALKGSRIHMLGVAYKRDIDDVRESPAVDVAHLLLQAGVAFTYYDQFVPHVNIGGVMYHSSVAAEQTRLLEAADCVVIGASHTSIDYEWVLRSSQLVYDAFDVFRGVVDSRIIR